MCTICSAIRPYANSCDYEEFTAVNDDRETTTSGETSDLPSSAPSGTKSVQEIADFIRTTGWGGTARKIDVGDDGTVTVNITQLTSEGQTLARKALDVWSEATGITFTYLNDGATTTASSAQIFFDDEVTFSNGGRRAYQTVEAWNRDSEGYIVVDDGALVKAKDFINISKNWLSFYGTDQDSYSQETYIHEIGHALGLYHTGNYNQPGPGEPPLSYAADAEFLNDTAFYSIMSYWQQTDYPFSIYDTDRNVLTPQMADILAVQDLYGDDISGAFTGNTEWGGTSNTSSYNDIFRSFSATNQFTIVDDGGYDSINIGGAGGGDQTLDLRPGTFSSINGLSHNMSIAIGTIIEVAYGSSNRDYITGNEADNTLYGFDGADVLSGGLGNDRLYGGAGFDILVGEEGDDYLDGGQGGDTLIGGAGNDTFWDIDGGSTSEGGTGDDLYLYSVGSTAPSQWVREFDNEGNDTLFVVRAEGATGNQFIDLVALTQSTFAEGVWGVENVHFSQTQSVVFTGYGDAADNHMRAGLLGSTLIGREGDDWLEGFVGVDTLIGGEGNDTIDGKVGADRMYGMEGDDTFYVDNAGDFLYEAVGDGYDTVYSSVSLNLETAGNGVNNEFEELRLTGTADIDGTGNVQDNWIYGNAGDNFLRGNDGFDLLRGGAGDDTLVGGEGIDTLLGDAGDDTVSGSSGADYMFGGTGSDDLYVDNVDDEIYEYAGEGSDTVYASISWDLVQRGDNSEHFENLHLIGSAIAGYGNDANNAMTGNGEDNVMYGRGGNDSLRGNDGDDALYGGAGTDALFGGDGSDTLNGETGADIMDGNDGDDVMFVDDIGDNVYEREGEGNDSIYSSISWDLGKRGDSFEFVENLYLTSSGDISATGNDLDNRLGGGTGNNTLTGKAGDDTLIGNGGNDVLNGGLGADDLQGGTGSDSASYVDATSGVKVNMLNLNANTGEAAGDTFTDIENLVGSRLNDTLIGNAGTNSINGFFGDDRLYGMHGDDKLFGGAGSDLMKGGSGDDGLAGSNGADKVFGEAGADTLNGGRGADLLNGGAGDDILRAGEGKDILKGGFGKDKLFGQSGTNTMEGGMGTDQLTAGTGKDTFIWRDVAESSVGSSRDLVLKFGVGTDTINLQDIVPGQLTFQGNTAFSGTGIGEVRLTELTNGSSIIRVDADGDAVTDMEILISKVQGLTADDFVF